MLRWIVTMLSAFVLLLGSTAVSAAPASAAPASAAEASASQAATPAIACPQFAVCFWQNNNFTGSLDTETSPLDTWAVIPTGNRGAVRNNFTGKTVWISAFSGVHAGRLACVIGNGGGFMNDGNWGRYYIDDRSDDTCNLIPPTPPNS